MSVLETEQLLATAPLAPLGLRLLPAPDSEPPYDDELPGGRPLPLRPVGLRSTPPLRLVPPIHEGPTGPELPPVKPFARAMVQRLLEVLAGVRPVAQLQRDMTLEAYDELELMLDRTPRTAGPRPDARWVRSVRVQPAGDTAAEGFATVRRGSRWGAVAFRLELERGRWQCTALEGL
ncbi:MAG: Rv3235 family protein [Actinobacteria bacterium]|nr:Rv3235 family protein [Actinomycetota bacterium]